MSLDVLIVSHPEDVHSQAVARGVEQLGGSVAILNNADFPLNCRLRGPLGSSSLEHADGSRVDLRELRGVWWRRPEPYKIAEAVVHPKLQEFTQAECAQAFLGALTAEVDNFVNPVGASRSATIKPRQLAMAGQLGLATPATLITNDPESALAFRRQLGKCVYKTFTGADFGFYETRELTAEDEEQLWRIRTCPMIVQEHVDGDFDVRVTVMDDDLFAAAIHFKQGRHPVDGRVDRVPITPHELPVPMRQSLHALVNRLGLRYCTIDLRRRADGSYVFFEVNPEGQFLWVEIEAELAISKAIARRLLNPNRG